MFKRQQGHQPGLSGIGKAAEAAVEVREEIETSDH